MLYEVITPTRMRSWSQQLCVKIIHYGNIYAWNITSRVNQAFVFSHYYEGSNGLFHFSASVFAFTSADFSTGFYTADIR